MKCFGRGYKRHEEARSNKKPTIRSGAVKGCERLCPAGSRVPEGEANLLPGHFANALDCENGLLHFFACELIVRAGNSEDCYSHDVKPEKLFEEIQALRDSVEELYLVLEHALRNREEIFDLIGREPVSCVTCDGEQSSLSEAVREGWSQFQPDGEAFEGRCPDCNNADVKMQRDLFR